MNNNDEEVETVRWFLSPKHFDTMRVSSIKASPLPSLLSLHLSLSFHFTVSSVSLHPGINHKTTQWIQEIPHFLLTPLFSSIPSLSLSLPTLSISPSIFLHQYSASSSLCGFSLFSKPHSEFLISIQFEHPPMPTSLFPTWFFFLFVFFYFYSSFCITSNIFMFSRYLPTLVK